MGCSTSKSAAPRDIAFSTLAADSSYSAWNDVESAEETDFHAAANVADAMVKGLESKHMLDPTSSRPSEYVGFKAPVLAELLEPYREELKAMTIEPEYTGFTLASAPAPEDALAFLEYLLLADAVPLHRKFLYETILAGIELIAAESGAVLPLPPVDESARQIIVGDTHGQLQDVLLIFKTHGPPSDKNHYLFNGDIADRGANACEIFTLILLFKRVYPDCVHVTRGNHELPDINMRPVFMGGGFYHEVTSKYDIDTFHLFQALFIHLPIGATLGGQAFVVHGGLMREEDLDMKRLTTLEHRRPCPEAPTDDDELLMFDALWADPQEESGLHIGGRGANTIRWGPDVTRAFLQRTKMELIIRSHQVPNGRRGFMTHHGGKGAHLLRLQLWRRLYEPRRRARAIRDGAAADAEHMAPPLAELRQAYFAEKLSSSSLAGARRWRLRAAHRGLASRSSSRRWLRPSGGWRAAASTPTCAVG